MLSTLNTSPVRAERIFFSNTKLVRNLIVKMTKTSSSKRPTAKEVLSLPLLQKYLDNPITASAKKEFKKVKELPGIMGTSPTNATTENIVSRSTTYKSPNVEEESKGAPTVLEETKDIVLMKPLIEEINQDTPKAENIELSRMSTLVNNQPLVKPNIKMIKLMTGIERVEEKASICECSVDQNAEETEEDPEIGDDETFGTQMISDIIVKYSETFEVSKKK
eukprot:TRINITY_DN105082_c2_g1_i1.p6 TRINITY_DN105082_c2_g1~~TRINITY_DN105082_c2_g1_i1.p6  ORF type:complete len:221 (-),score=34.43 TRINITY_DN105082_c2_g1_i1:102-764(-)